MRTTGKRGQSWSMDLVIGVVIFGFIAVIFYSLLTVQERPSVQQLQGQAQTVEQKLTQDVGPCGGPVIENQSISQDKLQCLYNLNSTALKQALNTQGNLCIYIEDPNGSVLVVQNDTGAMRIAIGDPQLSVSGTPCGSVIP